MSAFYCQGCDTDVDLDFDAEHYDECPLVTERKEEEAAVYWDTITSPAPTGLWRQLKCFLGYHGPLDVHEWRNHCECRSCGYEGLYRGEFDLI
jgi:hypothetical protein